LLNSRQFFIHEQIGLEFHGIPIPEFIGIPHFKVKTPEFHIPTNKATLFLILYITLAHVTSGFKNNCVLEPPTLRADTPHFPEHN
jgi:hypothetical protein